MALNVVFTRALPIAPDAVFLQWDVREATQNGSYLADLYVSQSSEGPWTIVSSGASMYSAVHKFNTTPLPNDHRFREPNQLSVARVPYYRIVITPPSGITDQVSAVTAIEPGLTGRQKNARRKMLRDARVTLIKGNGTPVAVCKRARWGARCSECVDLYSGDVVRGECLQCYGTGFVPGFMNPVITYAKRSPNVTATQIAESGKFDVNMVSMVLLDVPNVEYDDMIVFLRDNSRFLVRTTTQTELQTVGVLQSITGTELAYSSVEYRFPVDPLTAPALF